jgi:tRNA(Arg) A34 adenosine deaminase TadA
MSFPKELIQAAEVAASEHQTMRKKALIGCVIRRKDGTKVISRNGGVPNCTVTPSIHAEARASRKADVGSVAFVARVLRDGSYAMARPCFVCQAMMKARGVQRAYYTISDTDWGCLELSD